MHHYSKVEINSDDIIFKNKVNAYGKTFCSRTIRALELVKENGIVSYIIPKTFYMSLHIVDFEKKYLKTRLLFQLLI